MIRFHRCHQLLIRTIKTQCTVHYLTQSTAALTQLPVSSLYHTTSHQYKQTFVPGYPVVNEDNQSTNNDEIKPSSAVNQSNSVPPQGGHVKPSGNYTVSIENRYDLLIIGSGPAGQKAAINASKMGKRVAIVDKRGMLGGVCIHTGTIPSKTFREAILYLTGYRQRGFYGKGHLRRDAISALDVLDRVRKVEMWETETVMDQLHRNGIVIIEGMYFVIFVLMYALYTILIMVHILCCNRLCSILG